jgi:hypothetical protein
MKQVEPSLLQQTLEQQRAQSIEDEKWLQEQEKIAFNINTRPDINNIQEDPLFIAISDVSESIYEFTQSNAPIDTVNFVNAIEVTNVLS